MNVVLPPVELQRVLYPTRLSDAAMVHTMICGAIDESPFYGLEFKEFEKRRMSRSFIRTLINASGDYVLLVKSGTGDVAGVMISGPEHGNVFLYWSYLYPHNRVGTLAMRAMRDYVRLWDNGRFHKIVAMAKPDNRAPRLLMKRNGFRETALLERHLFGESYVLCERMLTKVASGYDAGLSSGLRARIWLKLKTLLPQR